VVALAGGALTASRTAPGRGAWLCVGAPTCLELACRRQAFARALRVPLTEAAVEELRRALAVADGVVSPGRR